MGVQGSLTDLGVADLIQHNCMEKKTVYLRVEQNHRNADVYIQDGNVVHAVMDDVVGEEVIYEVLGWKEGVFYLEADVKSFDRTIHRTWSALLLEGARRMDEHAFQSDMKKESENMAQMDELLKQMAAEINGFLIAQVTGLDGLSIAQFTRAKANADLVAAQVALLFKLVDNTVAKLNSGVLEDNLLTSQNAYMMMRFLPGKQYILSVTVDRKNGNLGNLRLITGIYRDRIAAIMPR